jgi:hypothetical protein
MAAVATPDARPYLGVMAPKKKTTEPTLSREWTLSVAATLGSSVRAKGILLEVRARIPAVKKALDVRGNTLVLSMGESQAADMDKLAAKIDAALVGIESLPVIPREIEDILAIKTSERHRWLKDGRLVSAGTRTVKLRGRARKITFHVFDPLWVDELLSGDQIDAWREEDAETAAENRRRAAWKSKLARAAKKAETAGKPSGLDKDAAQLSGWAEFARENML